MAPATPSLGSSRRIPVLAVVTVASLPARPAAAAAAVGMPAAARSLPYLQGGTPTFWTWPSVASRGGVSQSVDGPWPRLPGPHGPWSAEGGGGGSGGGGGVSGGARGRPPPPVPPPGPPPRPSPARAATPAGGAGVVVVARGRPRLSLAVSRLNRARLVTECRARGLDDTGTITVLRGRLAAYVAIHGLPP